MAQTPEAKVKDWLIRRIKTKYPSCWVYRAPGGRFGRVGVPDIISCINGLFVAIEVKSDTGTLQISQKIELDKIYNAKGIRAIVYGKDEERVNAIFRVIDRRVISKKV